MKFEKKLNYEFEAYVMFRRFLTQEAPYAEDAHAIHDRIDSIYKGCEASMLQVQKNYPHATEILELLGNEKAQLYYIPFKCFLEIQTRNQNEIEALLVETIEDILKAFFSEGSTRHEGIFQVINHASLSYSEKWALVSMVESVDVLYHEFKGIVTDLSKPLKQMLSVFDQEIEVLNQEWTARLESNTYIEYLRDTFGIVWDNHEGIIYPSVMANNSFVDVTYLGITMTEAFLNRNQLSDKNACKMMKSMGDPSKFAILKALNHGQKYGKELATLLGLTPATISYHIQELLNDGLIQCEPSSNKRVYYNIAKDRVRELLVFVEHELEL